MNHEPAPSDRAGAYRPLAHAVLQALARGRAPVGLRPVGSTWGALLREPTWLDARRNIRDAGEVVPGHTSPERPSDRSPGRASEAEGTDLDERAIADRAIGFAPFRPRRWGREIAAIHAREQALLLAEVAAIALVATPRSRPAFGPLVESVFPPARALSASLVRRIDEELGAAASDGCGPTPLLGACRVWDPTTWSAGGARALAVEALRLARAPGAIGTLAVAEACYGATGRALALVGALRGTPWRATTGDPDGLDRQLALARCLALLQRGDAWAARRELAVVGDPTLPGDARGRLSNAAFALGFVLALFERDDGALARWIRAARHERRRWRARELVSVAALVPRIRAQARAEGRETSALADAARIERHEGDGLGAVTRLCTAPGALR